MLVSTNQKAQLHKMFDTILDESQTQVESLQQALAAKTSECDALTESLKREQSAKSKAKEEVGKLNLEIRISEGTMRREKKLVESNEYLLRNNIEAQEHKILEQEAKIAELRWKGAMINKSHEQSREIEDLKDQLNKEKVNNNQLASQLATLRGLHNDARKSRGRRGRR